MMEADVAERFPLKEVKGVRLEVGNPPPRQGRDVVALDALLWLAERVKAGKSKYGTYLETFNGRDADQDILEELADAFMYQFQKVMEKRTLPAARPITWERVLEAARDIRGMHESEEDAVRCPSTGFICGPVNRGIAALWDLGDQIKAEKTA